MNINLDKNINPQRERVVKGKIFLKPEDKTLTTKEIQEKYGVPNRKSAWRFKKTGEYFKGYLDKVQKYPTDKEWFNKKLEELTKEAKAVSYYEIEKRTKSRKALEPLQSYELDDVVQECLMSMLFLSGHPDREAKKWRYSVYLNAIRDFFDKYIYKHRKEKDNSDVYRKMTEEQGENEDTVD